MGMQHIWQGTGFACERYKINTRFANSFKIFVHLPPWPQLMVLANTILWPMLKEPHISLLHGFYKIPVCTPARKSDASLQVLVFTNTSICPCLECDTFPNSMFLYKYHYLPLFSLYTYIYSFYQVSQRSTKKLSIYRAPLILVLHLKVFRNGDTSL